MPVFFAIRRLFSAFSIPLTRLPVLIHLLIVFFVLAGGDVVHPLLVVEIPAYRLLDSLLELQRGFPAQFLLQLARVDRIAQIVSRAVGHVGNQMLRRTFRTPQQPVDRADHHADQVDVAPLVEPSDIIGVADLSAMENLFAGYINARLDMYLDILQD